MVQVQEAVQKAQTYLLDIFQSAKDKQVRLEGVELSDDFKFWFISFSYIQSGQEGVLGSMREYKTVKLRAEDGEFLGARNGLLSMSLA